MHLSILPVDQQWRGNAHKRCLDNESDEPAKTYLIINIARVQGRQPIANQFKKDNNKLK